ncbi:hypothetical protein DPEC_G00144510 [Dallia pectoralis]|uniref:Uncharacterized protein n=1 Tax=Dallia pectoralis TaxID=75939 RepID=A0ACC2GNC9_DALPE|nr:hypothetical protein DPEC_G00144510 [Dallia pectoralis]
MDPIEYTSTTPDYYDYSSSPDTNDTEIIAEPCSQDGIMDFTRNYAPVAYSLVFVLALVGNVLVLCVWTYQWEFGTAVCKISGALISLNRYSGILFLACISFDRYLAIVHAVSTGWKRNTCHAQIACALIWTVCLGLSGVDITFRQVVEVNVGEQNLQVCTTVFPYSSVVQWQVALPLVNLVLGFGLPLLVMLYCYIRIFRSLCNASRRQKKKSLRLIVSLVSVFMFCWAPYNTFHFVESLRKLDVVSGGCQFGRTVDIGILVSESIGLSHCALNPLLYGFVGEKFRKEMAKMFKGLLGQRLCRCMEGWVEPSSQRRSVRSFSSESDNTSYFTVML